MQQQRTVTYEPKPGDKLVFGMKPGKPYLETFEVPDPWYFAPPENGYVLCLTSRSSTYSTQGYGSDRYAKGAADMRADMFREAGFEVHIRRVEHDAIRCMASYTRPIYTTHIPVDYQVWVKGENVAGEFTPYAATHPFAETVRRCWERGVNPRVYWPLLPHGYEEKHGFDYFGRKTTSGGVQ